MYLAGICRSCMECCHQGKLLLLQNQSLTVSNNAKKLSSTLYNGLPHDLEILEFENSLKGQWIFKFCQASGNVNMFNVLSNDCTTNSETVLSVSALTLKLLDCTSSVYILVWTVGQERGSSIYFFKFNWSSYLNLCFPDCSQIPESSINKYVYTKCMFFSMW